ncbi:TPA: hypothetical protein EYP13_04230 [Candidatus Micrarchaeota archaeon]|nr:hypothetical protein [Candidatus Micrarchaeota archaeon]
MEKYYQLLPNQRKLIITDFDLSKKEITELQKLSEKKENTEYVNLIKAIKEISQKTEVPEDIIYAIWKNESSLAPLGSNIKKFEKHIYLKYLKK